MFIYQSLITPILNFNKLLNFFQHKTVAGSSFGTINIEILKIKLYPPSLQPWALYVLILGLRKVTFCNIMITYCHLVNIFQNVGSQVET